MQRIIKEARFCREAKTITDKQKKTPKCFKKQRGGILSEIQISALLMPIMVKDDYSPPNCLSELLSIKSVADVKPKYYRSLAHHKIIYWSIKRISEENKAE